MKFLIKPSSKTEFNRVESWLKKNKINYNSHLGDIIIKEDNDKIRDIFDRWRSKYDTEILKIVLRRERWDGNIYFFLGLYF